jgi:hypothetical protein
MPIRRQRPCDLCGARAVGVALDVSAEDDGAAIRFAGDDVFQPGLMCQLTLDALGK